MVKEMEVTSISFRFNMKKNDFRVNIPIIHHLNEEEEIMTAVKNWNGKGAQEVSNECDNSCEVPKVMENINEGIM
jgi:hypothetical protein